MKSKLLCSVFIIALSIVHHAHANDMLMDPMPAAKPAPDFNLMGMDGIHHLKI